MKKIHWLVALWIGLVALGLLTHRSWPQIAVLVVGITVGVLAIDLGVHAIKQGFQTTREALRGR